MTLKNYLSSVVQTLLDSEHTDNKTMRYFLAILLPPLAVFLCGKPIQGFLNIILTCVFWIPGIVHALFVVHSHLADKRNQVVIDAIKNKDNS